jgi:hypothetical protein
MPKKPWPKESTVRQLIDIYTQSELIYQKTYRSGEPQGFGLKINELYSKYFSNLIGLGIRKPKAGYLELLRHN